MAIDIPAVVQSTDSLLCPGTKSVAHCVCVCMREAENQRMMLEQSQKGALQVAQVASGATRSQLGHLFSPPEASQRA